MILFKRKKEDNVNLSTVYGFSFPEQPSAFHAHRLSVCLLKAILIFSASFGTIGGLLSAFDVSYNTPLLFAMLFLFSLVLAFLHYNQIVFNIGYIVIFFIFLFSIFRDRQVVNSGFQAFVSILYEKYSSHFTLSVVREVTESVTDRYVTITVAALYIGFFLVLLLNIAISSHMSILLTILLTFPLLQLGIYIGEYPDAVYFIPLLFTYLTVGMLGRSNHFLSSKAKQDFAIKHKQKTILHSYHSNGKIMTQVSLLFAFLSLLFSISFFPLTTENVAKASNKLKASTDEYVKIFVQSGFRGFFNHYAAKGGMSNGRLGGVSSVRPDYQTDLTVTFAPYSYDTVYLKAFTGGNYAFDHWEDASFSDTGAKELFEHNYEDYMDFTAFLESKRLAYGSSPSQPGFSARMKIVNLDASPDYLYTPYYTSSLSGQYSISNSLLNGNFDLGSQLDVTFYPATADSLNLTFPDADILYESYSDDDITPSYMIEYANAARLHYLSIPPATQPALNEILEGMNLDNSLENQITGIQTFFQNHFTYSTNPGVTPPTSDFVSYFLTNQKRGYCAHFASAATLLFRSLGVPARYVEGYVIPLTTVSLGEEVNENYHDYITGETMLGPTGVIEVDISDANAHAWVEIYSSGFGWVPVEVTPPSDDSEVNYADFWNVFTGLFSVSQSPSATTQAAEATKNTSKYLQNFFKSINHLITPFLCILLLMILIPLATRLYRYTSNTWKRKRAFKRGQYELVIPHYYAKAISKLHISNTLLPAEAGKLLEQNISPEQQAELANKYHLTINDFIHLVEECCFSNKSISKETALTLIKYAKKIQRSYSPTSPSIK